MRGKSSVRFTYLVLLLFILIKLVEKHDIFRACDSHNDETVTVTKHMHMHVMHLMYEYLTFLLNTNQCTAHFTISENCFISLSRDHTALYEGGKETLMCANGRACMSVVRKYCHVWMCVYEFVKD